MGVKGLSAFILGNPDFLKPYKLHDSYVVIDGDNLVFPLYFYNTNVVCGGDYSEYAEYIRRFFRLFLRCNVKPIVVFDGGYDKSGRKLKTVFDRTVQRLSSVKRIVQGQNYNKQVLPILAHDVFITILNELNIPFVMCDYEADGQVAALANYYRCPVISNDSDFFIFDVHNGLVMLNSIEGSISLDVDSNGKDYKHLNCSVYYVDEFVSCFPGIDKVVLPLFGTLMGNDYVDTYEFDSFFTNIKLPKEEKLISFLSWLKNKSLTDAMNQILLYLNKENRDYLKSCIESSVSSYSLHNCNLSHIIDQKLYNSKQKFSFNSKLVAPCGNSLPVDFIIKYHSGFYSSFFANIIVLHKIFLSPQIDDFEFPSSYTCASYIRRVIYGILIRHDIEGATCQNEKCLAPIEEYDRHDDKLDRELVEPIFNAEEIGAMPTINELSHLEKERAKLILFKVLGVNLDFVSNIPAEWQLYIISINYWLRKSVLYPSKAFLCALILNLIYCDVICRDNAIHENPSKKCRKSIKSSDEWSSIIDVLLKNKQSELQQAAVNFKKYLTEPVFSHNNPLCLKTLHSYSELQSCVSCTVSLNKLLGTCMKHPDIHKCLNGSLIYNLAKDICTWSKPKLFVAKILGRETALFTLFALLDAKIHDGVSNPCILKTAPTSHKAKKKCSKQKYQKNEIYNKLDCHVLI